MDVRFREATAADLPALEVVRRQALEHGLSGEYDRPAVAAAVTAESGFADAVADPERLVVVAESEVTAFAVGVCDLATGRVVGVYVAPEYEREGWGTRVVDRLEAAASEAGVTALTAAVPRNARGFFAASGFDAVGETDRDGLRAVAMRKRL